MKKEERYLVADGLLYSFILGWVRVFQLCIISYSEHIFRYIDNPTIWNTRCRHGTSQRTTKPFIRLMRTARTQLIAEFSLIACALNCLRAIERGINGHHCHTGWLYRLLWAFAGHTSLTVGFVLRWFIPYAHVHKHLLCAIRIWVTKLNQSTESTGGSIVLECKLGK